MLDIAHRGFETAVIKMSQELKEAKFEELKESIMTVTHQIENINKMEIFLKKNQMEILKLKNIITKMKMSLARLI